MFRDIPAVGNDFVHFGKGSAAIHGLPRQSTEVLLQFGAAEFEKMWRTRVDACPGSFAHFWAMVTVWLLRWVVEHP